LGPNFPTNYNTKYHDDYIKYGDDVKEPVNKNIPLENLFMNHEPYMNQYNPISKDFENKLGKTVCPMRIEVAKIKKMLRIFAKNNKIPY